MTVVQINLSCAVLMIQPGHIYLLIIYMENQYILIIRLNQVGQQKAGDSSTARMQVRLVHNAYICTCLCALVLHIKQGF
jgi:hypothetical protein